MSGDPRPTGASTTTAESDEAPVEAQGQRLAGRVLKYEFLFVELFDFYWFSMMNYVIKSSFYCFSVENIVLKIKDREEAI